MKTFPEKLQNKKVIYYKSDKDIRIMIGSKNRLNFSMLKSAIEGYLSAYRTLSNKNLFFADQDKLNEQIKINLAGIPCTVKYAFTLYNSIVVEHGLVLPVYSDLHYQKISCKISPSKIT